MLDYLGHELYRLDLPAPANGFTWNGGLGAPTIAYIDSVANLEPSPLYHQSGEIGFRQPIRRLAKNPVGPREQRLHPNGALYY